MTSVHKDGPRSRYYDALLNLLDQDILPELKSTRAQYAYALARKQLARLAAVNDHAPFLPENLSAVHCEATGTIEQSPKGEALRQAILQEGRLLDDIEQATSKRLHVKSTAQETSTALPSTITVQTVETYLQKNLGPEIKVSELNILSGGRSKQTILITLLDGAGKNIERVIRRDMMTSPTGSSVVDEYAILAALADHGVPVPRPVLCEADPAILGSPFILVEKVEGSLNGHLLDPPSHAATLDSARGLAKLHAQPVGEIAHTIKKEFNTAPDAAKLHDLVLRFQKSWKDNARVESVTVNAIFEWLLDNVNALQPLTAIVHGDYSYHNILFNNDRLTAILDWELVRVGHPAEDLGFIRAAVLQRMKWEEFMAAYRQAGGPEIAPTDIFFYTQLEKLRLIIMLFKVRDFVESGMSDDIELINATIVAVPRLIHQLSVEMRNFLQITK